MHYQTVCQGYTMWFHRMPGSCNTCKYNVCNKNTNNWKDACTWFSLFILIRGKLIVCIIGIEKV